MNTAGAAEHRSSDIDSNDSEKPKMKTAMGNENYFESLPPNLRVFAHKSVIENKKPILFISHDQDGDWSFMDGGYVVTDNFDSLALSEILKRYPELYEIGCLNRGYFVERSSGDSSWKPGELDYED